MNRIILIFLSLILLTPIPASAFWMWTPETNKWVNPKFSVKETPAEQLEFGMEFYNSQQYKEAIREFEKLIKNYPRAREAPDAQFYLGKSFEALSDYENAFKNYQLGIDKYPFSERSAEIIKHQYELGEAFLEGKIERSKLKDAFSSEDIVLEIFRAVIKNAPYSEYAAPAQYKIGLYLVERKLYSEARDEFEKVMNDYPQSEWAKAAKYQIAMSDAKRSAGAQYDQRITGSAVAEFEEFVKVYPDADLSKEAKAKIDELREKEAENNFLIAEFYVKQKQYDAAKIYYQAIVDQYQNSQWASKALKRIGELSQKTQ